MVTWGLSAQADFDMAAMRLLDEMLDHPLNGLVTFIDDHTFGDVKTSGWGHHDRGGAWKNWKAHHGWDGRGFHGSAGDCGTRCSARRPGGNLTPHAPRSAAPPPLHVT